MNPAEVERLLYEMAKEAEGGVIVELGSAKGVGTIVLCRGTKDGNDVPVFSVDDFEFRTGWVGEMYGSANEKIWHDALRDAGYKAHQCKSAFHTMAEAWKLPIALLYWDPGVPDRFWNDWLDWNKFIISGGAMILKDTPQGHLGTLKLIKEIDTYWNWDLEYQEAGISVLRKIA